eukprot:3169719-Pyramimonas_sp.AAC.1
MPGSRPRRTRARLSRPGLARQRSSTSSGRPTDSTGRAAVCRRWRAPLAYGRGGGSSAGPVLRRRSRRAAQSRHEEHNLRSLCWPGCSGPRAHQGAVHSLGAEAGH